jgi:hypothetical protein
LASGLTRCGHSMHDDLTFWFLICFVYDSWIFWYIDKDHMNIGHLLFAKQAVWVLKIKVFGRKSTVVKWNYQILCLHPVMVCQKLGMILVIKWFKNCSYQEIIFTKNVPINNYSSMKKKIRKIRTIFDIENSLWKSKIGTFWPTVTGWRHKIW